MTSAATAALRALRDRFRIAANANADLDARLLLEHVSGLTALDLIREPNRPLSDDQLAALQAVGDRRLAGEPVHRILGLRDFHGLRFALSPDTLEPRPDTEILVDATAPLLRARMAQQGHCRLLDLGTGSGAIAVSLLHEVAGVTAVATDISPGALAAAQRNAAINGVADRFQALQSDWFADVSGTFDAILSNPPYIESLEMGRLAPEVAGHDPLRALDGGPDGLAAYRAIAKGAARHLKSGGFVGVEIGWNQTETVTALFEAAGYHLMDARRDLGGNPRVLVFARG